MFAEVILPLPLDRPFHYSIPENLTGVIKPGVLVSVPFGNKKLVGYVSALTERTSVTGIKNIFCLADEKLVLTPEMFSLGKWIAENYLCSLGEAYSAIISPALGKPAKAVSFEHLASAENSFAVGRHKLSESQVKAVEAISEAVRGSIHRTFLLHGITSSGKTEVYASVIEEALKKNKSSIFLLPEISLTPHFINLMQKRFPGKVGIWHSGLSRGEKYATWQKAKEGKIKIMVGPRSAVFTPFEDLGLIIVDEEHEPSYKQDQKPSYHARETAVERGRLNGAAVILGSATPSLESYYKAKTGEFTLLELKERVGDGILPGVKIIDSKSGFKKSRIISDELIEAISKVLAKREQTIIFLNRRGFAPTVSCQSCGEVIQCAHCSVSMVYHFDERKLKCHYCGVATDYPKACPSCKKAELTLFGAGTQKVEVELKKVFPQARVIRLDRDSASKKGVYEKAYYDFKKENFDILLGTQMVAKGFDFPRVTLVGVLDADTSLYFPDFRSAERTFQLLTQVAGRSGRSYLGGEVIIQTGHSGHYALDLAKNHDFISFYEKEIEFRKQMRYPPFSTLCNIIIRGKNEAKVHETSKTVHSALSKKSAACNKFEVLGPSEASRRKLSGMYRWQLLLKGEKSDIIQAVLDIKKDLSVSGIIVTFEMDPYDVL